MSGPSNDSWLRRWCRTALASSFCLLTIKVWAEGSRVHPGSEGGTRCGGDAGVLKNTCAGLPTGRGWRSIGIENSDTTLFVERYARLDGLDLHGGH